MQVIGISGQLQNGKDTVADRLVEKLNQEGGNWQRRAFAANVKKVFTDTFGGDKEFIEKWKVDPTPPPGFDMPVRQSLQFIGDGFRKIVPTIWLDLTFRDKSSDIIISDVRYVNEFQRVKAEGGINILVCRTDKLNNDPNGSEAQICPYVDWCLNYFKLKGASLQLMNAVDFEYLRGSRAKDSPEYPPDFIELFDLFILNDSSKEDLYDLIDKDVMYHLSYRLKKD